MTEGIDLYELPQVWVNGVGETCWIAVPEDGPWYQLSGEVLESLLRAAGYRPDGERVE